MRLQRLSTQTHPLQAKQLYLGLPARHHYHFISIFHGALKSVPIAILIRMSHEARFQKNVT